MKSILVIYLLSLTSLCAYTAEREERYVIFLHNRFLETHEPGESHPTFGKMEYKEIINAFENSGLYVISEKRNGNVNVRTYAQRVVNQIDSLIKIGTQPGHITVIGTSKGGYIAQYVSTLANNPALNYVFVACYRDSDLHQIPEINFCGNILSIYEKSDPNGVSAKARKQASTCNMEHFKEIELTTGMGHGFLFRPLNEWIEPSIKWAYGIYQ